MRASHPPFVGIEPLEPRMLLASVSWDGGGGDQSWHNPLNWSGDVLPGPGDDVTISVPGSATIRHDQDVASALRTLVCTERLVLSAGSIDVASDWRQSGQLELAGGDILGTAPLVIGPQGRLSIAASATALDGPRVRGRIVNTGTIELDGAGTLTLMEGLVNAGEMVIRGGTRFLATWSGVAPTGAAAVVHNLGTIRVEPGALATFRGAGGGVSLVSSAGSQLVVTGGTLNLFGRVSGHASWSIGAGAALGIGGLPGALATAAVHLDGYARLGGLLRLDSAQIVGAGVLSIGAPGHLQLSGAGGSIQPATMQSAGAVTFLGGTTTIGPFINNGTLIVRPGTLTLTNYTSSGGSTLRLFFQSPSQRPYIYFSGPGQLGGALVVDAGWAVPPGYLVEFCFGTLTGTFDSQYTTIPGRSASYSPHEYRGTTTGYISVT